MESPMGRGITCIFDDCLPDDKVHFLWGYYASALKKAHVNFPCTTALELETWIHFMLPSSQVTGYYEF